MALDSRESNPLGPRGRFFVFETRRLMQSFQFHVKSQKTPSPLTHTSTPGTKMKTRCTLLYLLLAFTPVTAAFADEGASEHSSFFSAENWKARLGVTDFQVDGSHAFGLSAGFKGEYETAHEIRLKLFVSAIVDFDMDGLDPDHIPVWFKSYFKAEKDLHAFSDTVKLLATLDFEHKMNTVSSIEQSADLMPGLKLAYDTRALELFAKFGAGGYYLEIDDDLPEIYSDYRREDLGNGQFAWFQEYKARIAFGEGFAISGRYKNFRGSDIGSLETRTELKFSYRFSPVREFVLKAEKTRYNLEQFERSAGDNGLQVLPFDKDIFYQAYIEYDF